MRNCSICGHDLGTGRFCTSCHPAGPPPPPRRSTPPPPPPGSVPPPVPRYPLYADEVGDAAPVDEDATRLDLPVVPLVEPPQPGQPPRDRRPWPAWLAAGVVLVLVLGIGAAWLGRGDERPGSGSAHAAGQGRDLTSRATVEVPATAPPNQDAGGNPVEYAAANMLDGVPETCWRMPGDGSGGEITITLPRETVLRRVGLVNGYAKAARDAQGNKLDWYHGNRRVLSVEWVFDDGTTLAQDLRDTTALQTIDVDVTTTTVTLRLVSVSDPGIGAAARDYTAISDLSLEAA